MVKNQTGKSTISIWKVFLKMIDIAPELDGAMDLVKGLKDKYVISLGHSDCDY